MNKKNTNIKQTVKAKKSQPKKATVQKAATPLIVDEDKTTEKVQSFQEQVRELRQCFTQEQDFSEGRQAVQQVVSPAPRLQTAKDIEEYQKKTSNVISKHNVAYGAAGLWYKVKFTSKKPMCIGEWETYLLNVHFNSPIKFHNVKWSALQKRAGRTKYAIAIYTTGLREEPVLRVSNALNKPKRHPDDLREEEDFAAVNMFSKANKKLLKPVMLYRNKKCVSDVISKASLLPDKTVTKVKSIKVVGEDKSKIKKRREWLLMWAWARLHAIKAWQERKNIKKLNEQKKSMILEDKNAYDKELAGF